MEAIPELTDHHSRNGVIHVSFESPKSRPGEKPGRPDPGGQALTIRKRFSLPPDDMRADPIMLPATGHSARYVTVDVDRGRGWCARRCVGLPAGTPKTFCQVNAVFRLDHLASKPPTRLQPPGIVLAGLGMLGRLHRLSICLLRGTVPMWKKLIILAGVVGVTAVVAKKVKSMNEERALWHEATTSAEDVH